MDIDLSGHSYKCGTIDARKQFHIVRRLAPVMGSVAKGGDALDAITAAISKLSDDDADYVVFGLLACVTRKQDNGLGWAKVSNGNALMFADISMGDMLKLAYHAFEANMQDFFAVIRSTLKEQQQPQSAQ